MGNKKKGPVSLYDVGISNPIHQQIVKAEVTQAAAKIKKQIAISQKSVGVSAAGGGIKPPPAVSGDNTPPPPEPDANYKWNLPPHQWSLPITPASMLQEPDDPTNWGYTKPDMEKYRRGRIWWYANSQGDFTNAKSKKFDKKKWEARKFGFQFLWNPDTYSTNVTLNMDATPGPLEPFKGAAAAYPSQESISVTLRLDRTNDFAYMRALLNRDYSSLTTQGAYGGVITNTDPNIFKDMAKYYKTSFAANITNESIINQQLKDLMELGTLADLEYLYKAVNGDNWTNIVGRKTSDIGFLSATLIRIDIGPASYIGYINSMNVNHMAFSQDMTPIRTDVGLQINLMTTAGVGQTQNGQSLSLNGGKVG